jgi:methionyl-tRNA synthetase
VKTCEKVPKKDKLLRLTVDLGEAEPRTIVAGLALSFTPEALVGKKVIIAPNSPSPGVLVAFIEEAGAPVELLQFEGGA